VRTSWPPAMAASTVHDFTGSPSSHTAQAPQLLVSQPQWVPVNPRWSRRKCTSSRRPSISRVTGSPLTLLETFTSAPRKGPDARAPQCPTGQLAGEVALVLDAAALVGRWRAGACGDRTCLGVELL